MGSRGEALAALYHETQFRRCGLEPFFEDGYRQTFSLKSTIPDRSASLEILKGGARTGFKFKESFVVESDRDDCPESVEGELVYCGFLIQAPERRWDDIKGADLRGKVLLCEINEPGNHEGGIFDGEDMTYYGRWTYKFEKAAQLSAAGVFIIHHVRGAAYGWEVVQNSWDRESFFLPDRPQSLMFQGWVRGEAAAAIGTAAGMDLRLLAERAESPDFKPVPLGVRARVKQKPGHRSVEVSNVAGIVRAERPEARDRYVILSAHFDHLGRNKLLAGDQVYNGAVDNCSASASLLALARFFSGRAAELKSSLVFAAVTAEEEGLLGSDYFARRLPFENSALLANLNLEMTNVWGETDDVYAIGGRHSELDDVCRRAAANLGLRYIPERDGNLGYFFRSDQLSFARSGIPAVWLHEGVTSRGPDKDFIKRKTDDYKKNRYHKAQDEIAADWDLRGTVQVCRWAREIVRLLGESKTPPHFKPASSFRRPGAPSRPPGGRPSP